MLSTDQPGNSTSPMLSPSNGSNEANLVENIGSINEDESWNDLSSPEPELNTLSELNNRLRTQINDISNSQDDRIGGNNGPAEQGTHTEEIPQWQKTTMKTLIFIGYTITTVLFSIIIYLHSLLVRCSYDEETSTTLLDGVFRAQEKAIDDYHRRHRIQHEIEDD